MELFTLLAKLVLDTKEYDREVQKVEGTHVEIQDPELGLDTSDFDDAVSEAEGTEISDPDEPELSLDDSEFHDAVDEAESTDVADPEEPKLDLDTSEFAEGIDESQSLSEQFTSIVGSLFENLSQVLITAGIVATITGFVSALKEGIELSKTHGDEIDKQSKKLGLSAKAYQEWAYALELSGANIDDLNRGLRTWQNAIGDEDKMADLGEAFEKLGIDAEEAFKRIESGDLDSVLNDVIYSLADYDGGDRGLITKTLFGNNSNGLNALLSQTSDDIKAVKQEANDLGLVMTDEEVANAAAYMDATTRLQSALDGIKEAFASSIIPLLTEAANWLANIIALFNWRSGDIPLSRIMKNIDEDLANELVDIEATAGSAETLVDKLLAMGDTSQMTAEQYAEWEATAELLIQKIPELGEVIDLETGQISANSEELKENIKQWKLRAIEEAKAKALQEKREALADKQYNLLKKEAELVQLEDQREMERIKSIEARNKILEERGFSERIDANGDVNAQVQAILDKYSSDEYEDFQLAFAMAGSTGQLDMDIAKKQQEINGLQDEIAEGEEDLKSYEDAITKVVEGEKASIDDSTEAVDKLNQALAELPEEKTVNVRVFGGVKSFKQAKGNWDVPYDNYPSLLHRDEMVLTATQARRYRQGDGNNNIDTNALAQAIGESIRSNMQGVTVRSYINGREVTEEVNRNQIKELKARRFAR